LKKNHFPDPVRYDHGFPGAHDQPVPVLMRRRSAQCCGAV